MACTSSSDGGAITTRYPRLRGQPISDLAEQAHLGSLDRMQTEALERGSEHCGCSRPQFQADLDKARNGTLANTLLVAGIGIHRHPRLQFFEQFRARPAFAHADAPQFATDRPDDRLIGLVAHGASGGVDCGTCVWWVSCHSTTSSRAMAMPSRWRCGEP